MECALWRQRPPFRLLMLRGLMQQAGRQPAGGHDVVEYRLSRQKGPGDWRQRPVLANQDRRGTESILTMSQTLLPMREGSCSTWELANGSSASLLLSLPSGTERQEAWSSAVPKCGSVRGRPP